MSISISAMAVFALAGAITPGPVNVLAVRHGANVNPAVPALFVLGSSLSYAAVVWLMGAGARHVLNHPLLVEIAQGLGAAYLLYLAWQIANAPTSTFDRPTTQRDTPWNGFAQGFAVQALNPKAWLVALSGIGLFVLEQDDTGSALNWFCVVSLAACGLGVGSWAAMGRLLVRWLALPARQRWFHRILATLLALAVVRMLT